MKRTMYRPRAIVVFLAVALLIMTSCGPPSGEDIPFETVLRTGGGDVRAYYQPEPKIAVATDPEELDKLKSLLSPNDWDALHDIDLSTFLVIAAFQGRKPSGGYKIEIVSVKRSGYQVYVIANFVTVSPGTPALTMVTSPLHVIKVKKGDLPRKGRVIFALMNTSGGVVAKTVHELR